MGFCQTLLRSWSQLKTLERFLVCCALLSAFCIVRVGGAAFLWLSGCSSLSLSLPPVALSHFPNLNIPLGWEQSTAEHSAALLPELTGAAVSALRNVEHTWRNKVFLHSLFPDSAVPHCLLRLLHFGTLFKMTEEKRIRREKLVGVWNPPAPVFGEVSGSVAARSDAPQETRTLRKKGQIFVIIIIFKPLRIF